MTDNKPPARRRRGIGSLVDAAPASPPVSEATGPVEAEQQAPAVPPVEEQAATVQPEPQQAPAASPPPTQPQQPAPAAAQPPAAPAPSANVPAVHVPPPAAPAPPAFPPPQQHFGGASFTPPPPQQQMPQAAPIAFVAAPQTRYNVKHRTKTISLRVDEQAADWLTTQMAIRVAAYQLPTGILPAKMAQVLIDNLHEIVRTSVYETHGYDIGPAERPENGGQQGHS